MTFGTLLAVVAAIATEAKWTELSPEPAGGTLVRSLLADYNKPCWMNHCDMQLAACVQFQPGCKEHFFCPHSRTPEIDAECFGSMRWRQLSERELGVFACAAENQCVASDHPGVSFLQEELLRRGAPGLSFLEEEGTLDMTDAEASKVTAVLKLRAASEAAQAHYAQLVAANAMTDVRAAQNRFDKLKQIEKPNTKDLVAMAAVKRRLLSLGISLQQQLVQAKAHKQARAPLDLAAIAKAPLSESQAPYLQRLAHVVDQLKRASAIKARRGTPRVNAALKRAAALKFLRDAAGLEAALAKRKAQATTTDSTTNLRASD